MAIVACFCASKGGVGKSTSCIVSSEILALHNNYRQKSRKNRVLVIDVNPQRHTSSVYRAQINDMPTLYDIMVSDYSAADCIQHTEYGDIIPCDPALQNADTLIQPGPKMYKHLKKAVSEVEDMYDFILIDTPPETGVLLGNALMAADGIIIPITYDLFGIEGLMDFYKLAREFQEDNPFEILGLLPVRYKPGLKLTRDLEDSLQKYAKAMGTIVFKSRIRESTKCQQAQTYRVRLSEFAPHCNTFLDYSAFVDELLSILVKKKMI